MTSKFTIGALQEEILIETFSHLVIEDLKSLSLTCTEISQIINECPEILKKFQLILTSESDVLGKFEVRKPYHVNIIMDKTICGNFEILKLFKNCKIKSLITNGKFYLNANEFPKMFPNIKSLSMNPSDQEICFSDFAQLESLHFKLELLTMELQLPKSLKKLSLQVSNYKINKPFDYKNNNIKELIIFEHKKLDWLEDFLADPSTNLDKLTLNIQTYRKESKDELDQEKSVKKYSHKIKKIKINIQYISKIPKFLSKKKKIF